MNVVRSVHIVSVYRIGRPRKSDVVSVSIDMHDLEKDLNYSKTKTPTISDGTKKDPSSLPSSTPDKVSVEVAFLHILSM